MSPEHTRESNDAIVLIRADEGASDGRSLILRLLRWGEVALTADSGRESFARGAFDEVDPGAVLIEAGGHDGPVVGKGTELEQSGDGAYLKARISDTSAGNDLLTLVRDQVVDRASISFRPIESQEAPDGSIQRVKAALSRVAILPAGAYPSAEVVAIRAATEQEQPTMSANAPQIAPEAAQATATTSSPDSGVIDRLDRLEASAARIEAQSTIVPVDSDPLDEWRDNQDAAGELFHRALFKGDKDAGALFSRAFSAELRRAMALNVVADNPGLIKDSSHNWLSNIIGPVAAKRTSIAALGSMGIPSTGMSVSYAKFDTSSSGYQSLITEQAAEGDEASTGKFSWGMESVNLDTYTGGDDSSKQLLERSEPGFRSLLVSAIANEWAYASEVAGITAWLAQGTAATCTWPGTDDEADLQAFVTFLVAQSIAVQTDSGSPATICQVATDVFQKLATNTALTQAAPQYGTVNVSGTTSAATLRVSISGLPIVHNPLIPSGRGIISVGGSQAAAWAEGTPTIASQDNVTVATTSVALYNLAAPIVFRSGSLIACTYASA